MSSFIKIQREISYDLNLKVRKLANKFNNNLIDLKIIIEEIGKINNNERFKNGKERRQHKKSIIRVHNRKDRRVRIGIKIFNNKRQIF